MTNKIKFKDDYVGVITDVGSIVFRYSDITCIVVGEIDIWVYINNDKRTIHLFANENPNSYREIADGVTDAGSKFMSDPNFIPLRRGIEYNDIPEEYKTLFRIPEAVLINKEFISMVGTNYGDISYDDELSTRDAVVGVLIKLDKNVNRDIITVGVPTISLDIANQFVIAVQDAILNETT